ncbi:MerR family transcriptional regulator [Microlunatus speluncae]|uniref:MerR family transcriptional regulator n=1 Tax=Microlunatus speluncae TaxID=2594267 RepID=UPI0012661BE8|nr:MerR family transcriptional regulator [Microlunatus speluncae]
MSDQGPDGTCGVGELTLKPGERLSIGQVAELTGLSHDTLRWYERGGLLESVTRDSGGRRQYNQRDLRRLLLLMRLRTTGMPVSEMQRYAGLMKAGPSADRQRAELLEAHRDRVLSHIADLERDLEMINRKIASHRRGVAQAAAG